LTADSAPGRTGQTGRILILIAMPIFSVLRFGAPHGASTELTLYLSAATYLLAVYLFYGIAWLAYLRSGYSLWISLLVAIVVGYLLSGLGELWMLVTTWTMLIFSSVITGRMNIDGYKQMPIYIAGVVTVALVAVAQFYPIWPDYSKVMEMLGTKMVQEVESNLTGLGANSSMIADNLHFFQKAMNITIRLLPATMLLGIIAQFTIGYLLFLKAVDRREIFLKRLRPFNEWKMPFALTPLLIIAIGMRILGNDGASYIADNFLAAVSVFYCATGVALMEGILKKLKVPIWMKILFYIMLFFTHVIGYLVTVLLGFVDSFADWRKVGARSIV